MDGKENTWRAKRNGDNCCLKKFKHCHGDEKTFIFVLLPRAKVKLTEGRYGAQYEEETAHKEDCLNMD